MLGNSRPFGQEGEGQLPPLASASVYSLLDYKIDAGDGHHVQIHSEKSNQLAWLVQSNCKVFNKGTICIFDLYILLCHFILRTHPTYTLSRSQ